MRPRVGALGPGGAPPWALPICVEAADESPGPARVERRGLGWQVTPTRLALDRAFAGGDRLHRSLADGLAEVARREALEALQVDLAHPAALAAAEAAALAGIPLVLVVSKDPAGLLATGIPASLAGMAALCVCRSRALEGTLRRALGPACPVARVPAAAERRSPEAAERAWTEAYGALAT